jgi:signal transduction histidine kinase/ligand-binding sensor domain-containing protein/DNA-binding response OmpR family regulator
LTGQKLRFYNSEQGIPSSLIHNVSQDSRGYIWVATENGASYFDGIKFNTFHHNSSLNGSICSELVKTVYSDSRGTCWVGTSNGLQIFDHVKNVFRDFDLQYPSFTGNQFISSVIESKKLEKIFVSVSGCGVLVYDIDSHIIDIETTEKLKNLYGETYLGTLFFDKEGNLWSYSEQGCFYKVNIQNNIGGKLKWAPELQKQAKEIIVSSVTIIPGSSNMLVGTYNHGLFIYDCKQGYIRNTQITSPKKFRIRFLLTENLKSYNNQLNIWVGTEESGLKIFDYEHEKVIVPEFQYSPIDLNNCKVHSVLQDNQGNIWAGIYQKGLLVIPKLTNKFEYIKLSASQSSTSLNIACVTSILRDKNDMLWVGTDGGGLFRIEKNGRKTQYTKDNTPLPNNAVLTLALDKRGTLWISTYMGGVTIYNPSYGFKKYSNSQGLQKVNSALYDKQNDRMFFGTLGHGLKVLDFSNNELEDFAPSGELEWINSLCLDSSGNIWIGETEGVHCFNGKYNNKIELGVENRLKGQTIGALLEGSDGTIWFGSPNGLYSYNKNNESLQMYSKSEGLPENMICAIQQDERNNLWVSTINGLAKFNPKNKTFTNFFSNDGLQDNEFRMKASFKDKDGKMFFGGINGISAFYPNDIKVCKSLMSNVYFTQLSVLNKNVDYNEALGDNNMLDSHISDARRITLKKRQNVFSLEFTVLEYANPYKVAYGYMLEGFDTEWRYTNVDNRRATYTNLPHGDYTFHVKAFFKGNTNENDIVQNEIEIIILPPWYRQWWAYLLYMAIFMLIVWFAIDMFIQHLMRLRERKEYEKKELKLRMFTDLSHEIRTPLTMVMSPLKTIRENEKSGEKRELLDLMYRNVLRILQLINQLMDVRKIDDQKLKMQFQNTDLIFFIKDIMKLFERLAILRNIDFRLISNFEVLNVWIDQINFDKVIFNILSNAFKYTPDNGYILISIDIIRKQNERSKIKSYVEISIKNSGSKIKEDEIERIFERFYQSSNNIHDIGSGIGLHLAKNIIDLHYGNIKAFNVEDGVIFTLNIPNGNNHLDKMQLTDTIKLVNLYSDYRKDGNIIDTSYLEQMNERNEGVINENSKEKYSLIIIDDDVEFGVYLKRSLLTIYNVKFYTNAKDAWNEISITIPDAILTDLIMPDINGMTLCERIKKNPNTNHIPVIILTSDTEEDSERLCFECGADHYLTKPLSIELLKSTIVQVINTRAMLKNKYNTNMNAGLDEVKITSPDSRLVAKVIEIIRKNIENPEFNVDGLSVEIGLSRVHLNRKLKANMNISPGSLIKSIRLKQAAYLLVNNKVNISDVAYKVGFSSHAYFSSSFKDYFGMAPGEFATKYSSSIEKENLKKLFEN